MFLRSLSVGVALLVLCTGSLAGHVEGEESNVVMITCVIDTDRKPLNLYVEAISANTTTRSVPLIRVGEPCAQALHEFLTAGFEIVNALTATDHFVLVRKDSGGIRH